MTQPPLHSDWHGLVIAGGRGNLAVVDHTLDGELFRPLPDMLVGTEEHCMVALARGWLVVVGGHGGNGRATQIYYHRLGIWVQAAEMPEER